MPPLDIAWTELLTDMAEINRRCAQQSDLQEPTAPNPRADEDALIAAEQRLGLHIDPQYRQFLTYVDGWPRWEGYQSLLGTQELMTDKVVFDGSGATGTTIFDGLHTFLENGGEEAWDEPHPPAQHLIPVEATEDVFYTLAVVGSPDAVTEPGPVFAFSSSGVDQWPSFAHYLREQISHWRTFLQPGS